MLQKVFTVECSECGLRSVNSFLVESKEEPVSMDELRCRAENHGVRTGAGAPRLDVKVIAQTVQETRSEQALEKFLKEPGLTKKPAGWREAKEEYQAKLEKLYEDQNPAPTAEALEQKERLLNKHFKARYQQT
ncbi:MAG: hypothetical protein H0W99_14560 [Acidobacteria bacterium]|jgi:hypothetical protein|nr:hypothetical protein [Acidobacteriota bacterium]